MSAARRARVAVSVTFAVHGAVAGTFATRLPWIAEHLRTDPGGLGLALLFGSVGAMTAMPFAGRLLARVPARPAQAVLMTLWCLAVIPTALAPSVPALCVAMLIFGATAGSADVGMNAQGVEVERSYGRSLMSGLHGMWSVGGLAGSAVGALAAYAGAAAPLHFLTVGPVLAAIAVVASRWLVEPPRAAAASAGESSRAFVLPPRPVLLIGAVGFAAIFGEASSADWAAVYLTDVAHAAPGLAAVAYTGFAATMAISRLAGDRLVDRFGAVPTVRASGAVASIGAVTVVGSRSPLPAILGFALIGVGIAIVVPLAFAAAGNAGPHPGQQIAGVATIVYAGGLAAPAAVGGIAHVMSLPWSFVLVAVLAALIVLGAGTLRRRAPERVPVEAAR